MYLLKLPPPPPHPLFPPPPQLCCLGQRAGRADWGAQQGAVGTGNGGCSRGGRRRCRGYTGVVLLPLAVQVACSPGQCSRRPAVLPQLREPRTLVFLEQFVHESAVVCGEQLRFPFRQHRGKLGFSLPILKSREPFSVLLPCGRLKKFSFWICLRVTGKNKN